MNRNHPRYQDGQLLYIIKVDFVVTMSQRLHTQAYKQWHCIPLHISWTTLCYLGLFVITNPYINLCSNYHLLFPLRFGSHNFSFRQGKTHHHQCCFGRPENHASDCKQLLSGSRWCSNQFFSPYFHRVRARLWTISRHRWPTTPSSYR